MKTTLKSICLLALATLMTFAFSSNQSSSLDGTHSAFAAPPTSGPQPVDESMHHFMEYVFEPNYKRLKVSLASEPKDKQTWKGIKGDALTLAEATNLLMTRGPKQNGYAWAPLSVAVRTHGSELYQAARKSDYTAARKAYTTMLTNCNACHEKYADGKHQLQP
jgi:cytochrome c553